MYKRISNKRTVETNKFLDKTITGRYMSDGSYECVVHSLEVKAFGNAESPNSATVTLVNDFGEMHRENIFFWSTQIEDLSYQLKKLLSTTLTSPEEIKEAVEEMMDKEWTILDKLIGKRVGVNIGRTDGYRIVRTSGGFDPVIEDTSLGTFKTLADLKKEMDARNLQRSYARVDDYYRVGAKNDRTQRSTFFDTDTTKVGDTGASGTGAVGSKPSRPLSSVGKFF